MRRSSATTKTSNKKAAATKKTTKAAATSKRATRSNSSATTQQEQQDSTPFEQLFVDMLKDIYWAEQHLVEGLKKMTEAATTDDLQSAFEDHLFVTQKHVSRLERVFMSLQQPAEGQKCDAMEALVKEAEKVIENTPAGSMTRDAGLIIAAQKVEHYEIATYGSLVQVALTLGYDQAAYILEKTLSEEEDTDRLLTEIAETAINPMADVEDSETVGEEALEEMTA